MPRLFFQRTLLSCLVLLWESLQIPIRPILAFQYWCWRRLPGPGLGFLISLRGYEPFACALPSLPGFISLFTSTEAWEEISPGPGLVVEERRGGWRSESGRGPSSSFLT